MNLSVGTQSEHYCLLHSHSGKLQLNHIRQDLNGRLIMWIISVRQSEFSEFWIGEHQMPFSVQAKAKQDMIFAITA